MELQYGHPADRAQPQQPARGPGPDRIAYTGISCYGRRITVASYRPATADAAGAFHTWGEIARRGALRSSYRRRWEWATQEAALAGHQDIAGWLTGVAAWLAGATDQIPAPPPVPAPRGSHRPPLPAPQGEPGMPALPRVQISAVIGTEGPQTNPAARNRTPYLEG